MMVKPTLDHAIDGDHAHLPARDNRSVAEQPATVNITVSHPNIALQASVTASLKARERLTNRERRRLTEPFASDPVLADAWGLKEAFRHIYRAPAATKPSSDSTPSPPPSTAPPYPPSRHSLKASANNAPSCWLSSRSRPPTATPEASVTRSRSSSAAPTASHLQWLPQTRRHSVWLTAEHDATPLSRQEPSSQPALTPRPSLPFEPSCTAR